jgi:hypothetical protein
MIAVTKRTKSEPGQKTNLHKASRQWATRPADERFWDLDELVTATKAIDASRKVVTMPVRELRADHHPKLGLTLRGGSVKEPTCLTHWGANLLFARIGAPARYLRSLPESTVAELVNHGLRHSESWSEDYHARLSIRTDLPQPHIEAFTSDRYGFIPNWKIGEGLKKLVDLGWRVPPARPCGTDDERSRKATKTDVLLNKRLGGGLAVKEGDLIAPAGLYASDKDLFCFLVNESNSIDAGPDFNLNRGIWVENSEVGAGSFTITTFLYDAVCGNHIVWGASEVQEISVRHIGKADARAFLALDKDLSAYLGADAGKTAKLINAAKKTFLGKSREEVVETVYANRRVQLSQENVGLAFDQAEEYDSKRVDPTSVWGMVCGITRLSQIAENADERTKLDYSASSLLATLN